MNVNPRLLALSSGLCVAILASAASAASAGKEVLEKYPGAEKEIMSYYAANAREGAGNCGAGNIENIGDARVVSESGDQVVLDVNYVYSATDTQGGSGCSGEGSREFTLTKGTSGYTVTDMTGQQP